MEPAFEEAPRLHFDFEEPQRVVKTENKRRYKATVEKVEAVDVLNSPKIVFPGKRQQVPRLRQQQRPRRPNQRPRQVLPPPHRGRPKRNRLIPTTMPKITTTIADIITKLAPGKTTRKRFQATPRPRRKTSLNPTPQFRTTVNDIEITPTPKRPQIPPSKPLSSPPSHSRGPDILTTLMKNNLTTMAALLVESGLDDRLANPANGTFTVFAPTDEAFDSYLKRQAQKRLFDTEQTAPNNDFTRNKARLLRVIRLLQHLKAF